jgi:hypothetical protein
MRSQVWYVALLIGVMGLVRFGLGLIGYIEPYWLMEQLGAPAVSNIQMPYIIRVWAIRDIVLTVLVISAQGSSVTKLLLACIAIDLTDIVSAHLSGTAGLFSVAETWSLQLTAIAALVPELIALVLLVARRNYQQVNT